MSTPEFYGSFGGGLIGIIAVWSLIYWYGTQRQKNIGGLGRYVFVIAIVIAIDVYGQIHFGIPAKYEGIKEGRKEINGLPISSGIEGHTFTPLAFTVTEHRILIYDKDEKVYALDGIKLEDGLKPETLTVGSNVSYTVYTKAGQLYFGRLEPPKPEKS